MRFTNEKKLTIPVSTGLLSPKHFKNIGPAIWVFVILIDMVTEEFVEEGERWGKVLGGRPVPVAEKIASRLDIHEETAKDHLRRLEQHGYIRTRRTPRGLAIDVRKSCKWLMRQHGANAPSNQLVIAELVKEFQSIPGVKIQDKHHSVMKMLLEKHGPDKVVYQLARLRDQANLGLIDNPLAWLIGTLDKTGRVPVSATDEGKAKRFAKDDCPKCHGKGKRRMVVNGSDPLIEFDIDCDCWNHPTKR